MGALNPQVGQRHWMSVSAVPLFKAGESWPHEAHVTFEDITDRKQAEQALRESDERFRRLAGTVQDMIYRFRLYPTQGFEYVSPSATSALGYSVEDCYEGRLPVSQCTHPDDRPPFEEYLAGKLPFDKPFVHRIPHKSGKWVLVELRSTAIYDEAGLLIAIEGIARDITDRRRAEEAMLERASLRELSHKIIQSQEEEQRRLCG